MRDHALCSIRDASIWKSYRRAALRSKHAVGRSLNSDESIAVTLHQLENDGSLAVGELADVNAVENDPEKNNLRTEIKRLRRIIRKKNFLIDLLMEKIVKLQKFEISATEDGVESGEYRDPFRCHPSSSMISMDLLCDDPKTFARNSSISSASSVNTEGNHIVRTSDVQLSKPMVKPESVVVRKILRHAVYEGREDPPRRVSRYLAPEMQKKWRRTASIAKIVLRDSEEEVLNTTDVGCVPCSNDTFVVQGSSETGEINAKIKNKVCGNVIKHLRNGPDQNFCSSDGRFSHNVFVIESFSSRSEDSHPDWKAPLPPSMYLRKNRPELIRRIENRQAAIRAATILRQRVTKEKMKAARDVVQGKCTVNSVRKNLMLDPTRITAFPMSEMTSLSKRHLRTSPAYQTEVSGGKSRLDIAASRIIAHTFSEATRQAILTGRSRRF